VSKPLVEHHSRKAARILDSARGLVLDHGAAKVTVAEITRAAGVGKGTVYLYWPTKEDLILGLFARDVLTGIEQIIERITAEPATVLPRRLAVLLMRSTMRLPLARRLQGGDLAQLRLLAREAGDRELFERTRPSAMCNAVMPILRRHGLIRDDRPLDVQAYTMHAVLSGFFATMDDLATAPLSVDDPEEALARAVSLLFEPATAPGDAAVAAAAGETAAVFHEVRDALLGLIDRSQTPG
jgi:AcrR family transcriptional regulator